MSSSHRKFRQIKTPPGMVGLVEREPFYSHISKDGSVTVIKLPVMLS